jgi:hypothetical protein
MHRNVAINNSIGVTHYLSIATWWTLLIVFSSAGDGNLGILWSFLGLAYFLFHPDGLMSPDATVQWKALTAMHLFELLAAAVVYAATVTYFAWSIGLSGGAFDAPNLMFYAIGISFLLMTGLALGGIVSYLFTQSGLHTMAPHMFAAGAGLFAYIAYAFFPEWKFSKALAHIAHLAEFLAAVAMFLSFLVYRILSRKKK